MIPPLVYDDHHIGELISSIDEIHLRAIKIRGLDVDRADSLGKVSAVVYAVFAVWYDQTPQDRHDYEDIFDQIADFAERLATAHPYADANKRTAVWASLSILYHQRVVLTYDDPALQEANQVYQWIQDVVKHDKTRGELAEELRSHAVLRNL